MLLEQIFSKNMTAWILVLSPLWGACSRGGGDDRQEKIASLRTLGIAIQNPLVTTPSVEGQSAKSVLVKLYAAVPLGEKAAIQPFEDAGSGNGAINVPASSIDIVAGKDNLTGYHGFQLFTAEARIIVPTLAQLRVAASQFIGGQLRYGLTVATTFEHEDVIANILVVPDGAAEVAWTNPSIDTPDLVKNNVVSIAGDIDLKAAIVNPNNESLKVGWFVTDGEVSNRRAAETVWTLKNPGPVTVAVVVHGTRSRGFDVKVIDVTAQ